MNLILRRFCSDKYGTRGRWIRDDQLYICVLEPEIPVIPAGDYVLNRYFSDKKNMTVFRFERPGDDKFNARCLEAHIGNCYHETNGCNLVGSGFGVIDFTQDTKHPEKHAWGILPGVINSRATFEMIIHAIPDATPIKVEA